MLSSIILLPALLAAALARPSLHNTPRKPRTTALGPHATPLTIAGLTIIAPNSTTCADALYPSECRTAPQSLPHILASFARYNITHGPVRAALVALMAYESGEFKYNVNHWPGVPGQGTRNMQSAAFNAAYARDLGFGEEVWGTTTGALMAAVGRDEYSFASAAWFVATQCGIGARVGMWGGTREGWEAYLTECVGATLDEGRVAYWERAMGVLGG